MSSLQPSSGWITRLSARYSIVGTHYLPVRRPPKIDPRSSAVMVFRSRRHDSQSLLMVDAVVQPTPSVTRGNPNESRCECWTESRIRNGNQLTPQFGGGHRPSDR